MSHRAAASSRSGVVGSRGRKIPATAKAKEIAHKITGALGGYGIFGVEMFIKGDEVIFSEVSPRPHDTGMVTMISQDLSEFALHARAVIGLPIPSVRFYGASASKAIVVEGDTDKVVFENLDQVVAEDGVQIRLFGKPEVVGHRRFGVILATDETVEKALAKAERAYAKRAISEYKRLRTTIQQGDLYKLVSPYEGRRDYASLMYVEPTKEKAVVFVYRMLFTRKMHQKIIKFQGLDPERKYLIKEVAPEVEGQPIELDGKIVSGRYLMDEGVVIKESSRRTPYNDIRDTNDYRSCILELIAQ